ncbi:3-oxoacyl-[acyl-carrier-protein] reductase [Trachymyrmex septentrionalis]|uniref:3-oxoacyl-[acyl-carrier-protein] reductase n=1 Tax=Trachymyrmex septentrionalis TaxID=34720 RepID=A0A151JWN0_9HYME|nr:3-oxoacyl-[acyl-carrier-protein] reductase [Trachymyrmex septentrionalis]
MSFAGKVVLITGASSGIGAETAIHFAQLGASLSITGRNKQNLEKVAEQCGKSKPFIVTGDLANENDVKNIIDSTIKHYGKLDVLVNNAGIVRFGNIEIPLEHYDNIMNVNVRSVFQLTALAVPYLIKTKGNIVNVSSVAGLRPLKNSLPYCMSKAALDQFTRCVALELASRQVRVNSVNPGAVQTNIIENIGLSQEQIKIHYEKLKGMHALGRIGDSLEIAKTIAFLASDDASFMTGVTLLVDGGIVSIYKVNLVMLFYDVSLSLMIETSRYCTSLLQTRYCILRSRLFEFYRFENIIQYRCKYHTLLNTSSLKNIIYFVRVNAVNPGLIETNIFRNSGMNQEQLKNFFKKLQKIHALGRNGDTSEVAKVIIFLASDDASFITGVTLPVDGGAHALSPVSIQSD